MDGEAVAEAFDVHRQCGDDEAIGTKDEMSQNIWSAVIANRTFKTRYAFKDKQPESFWTSLREAVDPLFEDIVLV